MAGTIDSDADYYTAFHALDVEVGIGGIFSDWPATVTYCKLHGARLTLPVQPPSRLQAAWSTALQGG